MIYIKFVVPAALRINTETVSLVPGVQKIALLQVNPSIYLTR